MENVTLRYLGPFRDMSKVPRKVHTVYDPNLGRNKVVNAEWYKEGEDIIAPGIPLQMAQRICGSSKMYEYFSPGEENGKSEFDKSRLVAVELNTTNPADALREENAALKQKLEETKRAVVAAKEEAKRSLREEDLSSEEEAEMNELIPEVTQ